MWPILTKVQYESLPRLFTTRNLYIHIALSLFLNWIIGPLIMLALAWATLPDLPTYRAGVIMVGLARCIAMVMIWNQLARGDSQYCAILVVINSVLQIILYSPYSLLFVNIIGGGSNVKEIRVDYGDVAISVLIVRGSSYKLRIIIDSFTTVPWHSTRTGCLDALHRALPDLVRLSPKTLPPYLLPTGLAWAALHDRGYVRVSRAPHLAQPRASVPGLCPNDPVLLHHVDDGIRVGVEA